MFGAVFRNHSDQAEPTRPNMDTHAGRGRPQDDWKSERSYQEPHYPEKQPPARDAETSKRYIWRLFRLGASIALTIAALVLTLIILVVGRHGNGGSDLSLITVSHVHVEASPITCAVA